ncbi:MAG: hypothetical protein J6Z36_02395, partial [Clostridia bacterium]|nr:hypothetical protein [Clostridia bacterium]
MRKIISKKWIGYFVFAFAFVAICIGAIFLGIVVRQTSLSGRRIYRFEAEKAIAEPAYNTAEAVEFRANGKSENVTSNGKYIGNLKQGNTVTWFFSAKQNCNAELSVAIANASSTSSGFTLGGGKVVSLTLNGAEIAVDVTAIGQGSVYCDNWQTISLGAHALQRGINQVV